MRGSELLDKLELVNPNYVEEADGTPRKQKPHWVRGGMVAACLGLALLGSFMLQGQLGTSGSPAVPSGSSDADAAAQPAGEETEAPGSEGFGAADQAPGEMLIPGEEQSDGAEQPAGEGIFVYTTGLELTEEALENFTQPESLELAVAAPVTFSEAEIQQVLDNLAEEGWDEIQVYTTEDVPGLLFFGEPEPEDWEPTDESQIEYERQFLQQSGFVDLFRQKAGIELSDQPQETGIYQGNFNGYSTENYIRLAFYPQGTLAEMKLYSVKYEPAFTTEQLVPVQDAVNNAFAIWEEDYGQTELDSFAVTEVEVIYQRGLPFYRFTGENARIAYALAVEEEVLEENEALRDAYNRILEEGF